MTFSDKLIALRKKAGWSQEELAEKTARLNELNVLLKVDEKDKTLIDSVPDEGEEVPERKVVGLER